MSDEIRRWAFSSKLKTILEDLTHVVDCDGCPDYAIYVEFDPSEKFLKVYNGNGKHIGRIELIDGYARFLHNDEIELEEKDK